MRRGFKAEAERRSLAARQSLGLGAAEALCPWKFSEALGVLVLEADKIGLEARHASQLLVKDPDSWSGMTLFEDGGHLVVLNPTHSRGRRASTLMHELAHIILEHVPAEVSVSATGLVLLSDYSAEQEEEADWLGAALLLPEGALLQRREAGESFLEIAERFGVSEVLCAWRCRMTGVERRLTFRRRAGYGSS